MSASNLSSTRIYLSPPHMGEDEIKLVSDAFASNWLAPIGPHLDAFEKIVAEYLGMPGAVGVSSGTAAIHLALRLLGIGPGDSVFCSSLTFIGSTNPILYLGARPVFIDSDPTTWNMAPPALERALEEGAKAGKLPKAVVVVSLYGQSADMGPLSDLCNRYEVPLVEDAAESLGATYHDRKSGSFGDLSILSFNGNKIITTSSGGMLLSRNARFLEKARFWATQARDPAPHYQHSEIGYNYRLSNVLAAIGCGQMRVLEQRVAARRAIFERYYAAFSKIPGVTFMPEAEYGRCTRWLTAMTIDSRLCGVSAADLIDELSRHNIEARPVWKPLHLQPLFAGAPYYPYHADHSVSDRLFQCGICLPSGSSLREDQQERIIELLSRKMAIRVDGFHQPENSETTPASL